MKCRDSFELSADWLPSAVGDDCDVAAITIKLGDQVVSRFLNVETNRRCDSFNASTTAMGFWFLENWWRLRCETIADPRFPSLDWRLRHELNSIRGDVRWPLLMIYSIGERIIFAPSFERRKSQNAPRQYQDFSPRTISASEYETVTDAFLNNVITKCAGSIDGRALKQIFDQIHTERMDAELTGWRRLEACLGYDPDQAPDAVINALIKLDDVAGESGVEEAALASPGEKSAETLEKAIGAARESNLRVNFDLASQIKIDRQQSANISPWRLAENAAAQLRRIIGVPRGPLKGSQFADIFKTRWDDLKKSTATARGLAYGACLHDKHNAARLALQTSPDKAHDRRFELARQFGDVVWNSGINFGIISRSRTDRQKFQRAFALSLLCPFDDISNEIDLSSAEQGPIEATARKYHVHQNALHNLLAYKGFLPFASYEEELDAL